MMSFFNGNFLRNILTNVIVEPIQILRSIDFYRSKFR